MYKLAPMTRGLVAPGGREIPWDHSEPGEYVLVRQWPAKAVVAYARVSTDDQAKDGNSLGDQVQHAVKKAAEMGQKLAALYMDPGLSASKVSTDKRPGCRKLHEEIEQGRVHTVIVYKRDRVSRKIWQWLRFWELCTEQATQILFTASKEPPMSVGPMGAMFETVFSLGAQLEAIALSTRVTDGYKAKIDRGEFPGSHVPFGYLRDGESNLVFHPEHAAVVRTIFDLAIREGLGAQRIAGHLNDRYPNPAKGKAWDTHRVARLLKNPVYAGYYEKNGTLYRLGKVMPFVSEREFRGLRSKVESRTRLTVQHNYKPKHQASPYLLKGLLVCGVCGSTMIGRCTGTRKGEPRREYRCECPARIRLDRESVEQTVVALCAEQVLELGKQALLEVIQKGLKAGKQRLEADLQALQQELEQAERALQLIMDLAEKEPLAAAKAQYAQRVSDRSLQIEKLNRRIADKRAELEEATAALDMHESYYASLMTWADQFSAATDRERRVMLVALVEKVIYQPEDSSLEVVFQLTGEGTEAAGPGPAAEFTVAVTL